MSTSSANRTVQGVRNRQQPKRIVVLGSGYAGIHACRTLWRQARSDELIEVVLLSDVDHLLYVTMVYEVAAGNLAPSSIRQSVRTMISRDNVRFRQGKATAVDFKNQTVSYQPTDNQGLSRISEGDLSLSYDYLVSAIGSETNFFGTPGAQEYAYPLKRLEDGKRIKNTLLHNFERASLETDEAKQRELLSVVIVGGGPTGVSLAAKIADMFDDEIARAFPELVDKAQITIVEGKQQVVTRAGGWFSRRVGSALERKPRVQVLTESFVDEVLPDGVQCGEDHFIRSECVIWTAGVKAREFDIVNGSDVEMDDRSRRIHVNQKLQIPQHPEAYVAGDQAWVERVGEEKPYPMRAQFAVREGQQAARNILADIRGKPQSQFAWEDKGLVISVGHGTTFAEVAGFKFSGFPATIAYKSIYLMSTIGIRAKFRAVLEWFMNLFLPRDISEL